MLGELVRFAVLLFFLSACGREDEMRALAAQDYGCPAESVRILERRADIGEPTWEIDACGHRARYTCHIRPRGAPARDGACEKDLEYPDRAPR